MSVGARVTALALAAGMVLGLAGSGQGFIRLTNGGTTGLRFAQSPISYVIHASGSDDVGSDDSEIAAVRLAFETWSRVGDASIRFREDTARATGAKVHANDGVNMVLFDENNSTGLFTGASYVIAITPVFFDGNGAILDSDVVFNGLNHQFSTSLAAGRYDVQNIATHEIGHFLGFDHTGVYGACLCPFAFPQDVRLRSLAADDVAAAAAVYPAASGASRGSMVGQVVRDVNGRGINGAHVVAVNVATGEPEASALTATNGNFSLELLRPGSYRVYAEPLDGPCTDGNIQRDGVETGFATTFYGGVSAPTTYTLASGQRNLNLGQLRCDEMTVAFNLDGAQPKTVVRGSTATINLAGTGLQSGMTVEVVGGGVRLSTGGPSGELINGGVFTCSVDANATPGLRDIYVYRGSGQFREVVALPGGFEVLAAAPRVTSLSPTSGTSAGGASVTINGTGFQSGIQVLFGDRIAPAVAVNGAGTQLTVTTPESAVGTVALTVINPDGQQGRLDAAYSFAGIPALSAVAPRGGPSAGGVRVTLTGERFSSGAQVLFDGTAGTNVVVSNGGTTLECTTPRKTSGTIADVTVRNPGATGGDATIQDGYRFIDPEIRTIDPAIGSTQGGTVVVIQGDGFSTLSRVDFGSVRATNVQFVSQFELRATAPAQAASTVNLTVVTSDGRSDAILSAFRYVVGTEPTITSVSPVRGYTDGGTLVMIRGNGFEPGVGVFFGNAPAQAVQWISANDVQALTPAGSPGPVDLVLRNASGLQARAFNAFTYDAVPGYTVDSGGGGGGGCSIAAEAGLASRAGALLPWVALLCGLALARRRLAEAA